MIGERRDAGSDQRPERGQHGEQVADRLHVAGAADEHVVEDDVGSQDARRGRDAGVARVPPADAPEERGRDGAEGGDQHQHPHVPEERRGEPGLLPHGRPGDEVVERARLHVADLAVLLDGDLDLERPPEHGQLRDEPRRAGEEGAGGKGDAEHRRAGRPPHARPLPDRDPRREGEEGQPVAARELGPDRAADEEAAEGEVDGAEGGRGQREERRRQEEGERGVGGLGPGGGDRDDGDGVEGRGDRGAVGARDAAREREDDGDGAEVEDGREDARDEVEPRGAVHAEGAVIAARTSFRRPG